MRFHVTLTMLFAIIYGLRFRHDAIFFDGFID